ncbi:hypothetical protein FKM82_010530 [Ascaphus truei]
MSLHLLIPHIVTQHFIHTVTLHVLVLCNFDPSLSLTPCTSPNPILSSHISCTDPHTVTVPLTPCSFPTHPTFSLSNFFNSLLFHFALSLLFPTLPFFFSGSSTASLSSASSSFFPSLPCHSSPCLFPSITQLLRSRDKQTNKQKAFCDVKN